MSCHHEEGKPFREVGEIFLVGRLREIFTGVPSFLENFIRSGWTVVSERNTCRGRKRRRMHWDMYWLGNKGPDFYRVARFTSFEMIYFVSYTGFFLNETFSFLVSCVLLLMDT